MKSFVLRGQICTSVSMDEIGITENGYLVVEDGLVRGVFRELPGQFAALPLNDCGDCLILPGMTDLHVHAPQFAFRGLGMDMELLEWLNTYTFPEESKYRDLEYAHRAYESFVRHLVHSTTTRASIFATIHVPATLHLMELLEQSGAEVLHISPSHHYPTGTVTPITRRQALMRWLTAQPGRYLIEDDYDSEFRFSGLPIPTIQSMDRSGRVIYMNTFSRTISPSLRISYMILPRTLLPQWQAAMGFYSCTVPSFEQMTLTRFLAEGYFEKHLSRMKKYYRAVRAQLFSVLHTPQAVRQCAVHDTDAGLHLVLELKNAPEPEALRALLRQSGLPDALLSDFFLDAPSPQAQKSIVLGYADAEPARLEAALTALFTRLEAREAPV